MAIVQVVPYSIPAAALLDSNINLEKSCNCWQQRWSRCTIRQSVDQLLIDVNRSVWAAGLR